MKQNKLKCERLLTPKIICTLDAVKGLHFPFGEEEKGLMKYLSKYKFNKPLKIKIGSSTLLLALDIYCRKNNIDIEFYDRKGKRIVDNVHAHRYVCNEYIELDLFGLKYETSN